MQNIIYRIFILSVFTYLAAWGYAQERSQSPAVIETMKQNWMWNKTTNAAGLKLDNSQNYTSLSANYDMLRGNFHQVMRGEQENKFALKTEGGINVKKFYFWGKFNYSRDAIKEAMFNASIIDPYRGMPYFVADTNSSNWNNQHYELEFKVSFPKINDRLAMGIAGEYRTSIGAKQRDIRTENYFMKLSIRPGLIYSIDRRNHLGLNLEYYSMKEESHMRNVNSYVDQPYYKLYGLGNATIGIGNGRTTNYVGNNFGGGIQYNYSGEVNLMLTTNYSVKVEDAEITFTTPKEEGTVLDKIWKSKAKLHIDSRSDYSHYIEMDYLQRHRDGIEYTTKYDDSEGFKGYITLDKKIRSTYENKELRLGYILTKNQNNEYKWLAGSRFNYTKFDDEYILPKSLKNGENISGELFGKRNFSLADRLQKKLIIGGSFLYNKNLSGNYTYGGAFKKYPIHSQLVLIDNYYQNSDYFTGRLSGIYSQKIKENSNLNLFVKASFGIRKTSNYDFNARRTFSLSIGCLF